jgi:uncharacterized phage protein (TIGR01671 family)
MREIKFRAWDKKHKEFVQWSDISRTNILVAIISNIKRGISNCELMQYIGLKDKNLVEIYDGDIIKDSSGRLMIVEWDNRIGTARYIFRVINTIGHIKTGRLVNTHEWITSYENDIEVIGNIYENQELTEEVK